MYVFPKKQLVKGIENQKQKLSQKFSSWNTEFREGLSYSFQNKSIASLMIISFLWNLLIWGTSPTLLPIFNKNQLMEGATGYGMLGAATSFGIVIGSLVIGALKVKHSLYELVMFSIILHGIVYAFLFYSIGFMGCCNAIFIIWYYFSTSNDLYENDCSTACS